MHKVHSLPPGAPPQERQPKKIVTLATNKEIRTGKLSLLVPLYDFGYVSNLLKAQGAVVEASIHDRDRIRQNLLFLVSLSFYRALEAAKIEGVVLESIRILEKQLATAKDMFSVGFLTKNDVLVIEVQLSERSQELIEARHLIESDLATMSRLTGKTLTTVEELQDVEEPRLATDSAEAMIAKADTAHPVLKKIIADRSALAFDIEATKAENFPDINGFASANTSSDTYLLHKNWVQGGVGIEIPIFDGGIVASKVAQKKTELTALDFQYKKAIEDIHLEIRRAFLGADSAFHRVIVTKKTIQLAEDNLTISQDLFSEGQIMSDDVLDDEGRLVQARSDYCQALYEFYMAKSGLEYAAGLIQLQA
jgi:outer membrane protein TolC